MEAVERESELTWRAVECMCMCMYMYMRYQLINHTLQKH